MKGFRRFWRFGLVLVVVIMVSLSFGGMVWAREGGAIVEVFSLIKPYVLLKITFPTDIEGDFAGTLLGRHFDCLQTAPNVLICIGPFRSPDPALLTIYDEDGGEIILQNVISPPQYPAIDDDQPSAPQPVPDPIPDPNPIPDPVP